MQRRQIFVFCVLFSFAFFWSAFFSAKRLNAQVRWSSPREVRWGDTLTIYYNTKATRATLSTRDAIYANIFLIMSDGARRDTCVKMSARGDTMKAFLRVADSVAYGGYNFETPERSGKAGNTFIALRRDGVPARGAALSKIWDDSAAFDKERQNYPDNYKAYPEKWEYMQYAKKLDSSGLQRTLRTDMEFLESVGSPNAELYAALAEGYSKLKNTSKQLAALERLAKDYVHSPVAGAALTGFGYRPANDSIANIVRALNRDILARRPESKFARKYLDNSHNDTVLTTTMIKPVVERWIHDEPLHPKPYARFLDYCNQENISSDTAILYAQRLMDIIHQPETSILHNLNNARWKAYIY